MLCELKRSKFDKKPITKSNGIILFLPPEIWQFLKASINSKRFTPKVKNIDNVHIVNGVSHFIFRLMFSLQRRDINEMLNDGK